MEKEGGRLVKKKKKKGEKKGISTAGDILVG